MAQPLIPQYKQAVTFPIATHGIGVILENRYYGASYPFNTSTTDQLAFLDTAQTIADNSYFAQNAVFSGIGRDLTAPATPWILYGGSLAGAQTAFSVKKYGDILYGGIASSAPINVVVGYPEWYNPIQKYAPQDCVNRINNIIDKFDALVAKKHRVAIEQFKALFGLEALTDHRDFASAISDPIGNPGFYLSNTWQELNWNSTYGSRDFFHFCGNVSNIDAPKEISDVDYSLSHYTNGEPWVGLGGYAGTQNQSAWADITNSGSRSYLYTSCTEQGAYIDSPKEGPSLISRVIDISYEQQWCTWAFPKGEYNKIPPSPDLDVYNSFGSFNFTADRLAFIDGDQDVWNELCYHSPIAPARQQTSDLHPELLITGAGHHWDSSGILNVEAEPQFIREAHLWEKLVDTDDYLELGDSHEEAMRKHRVGDPVKALRFADRALDVYSQGLARFPRSFDLAYNKARLELEKATDPVLSGTLNVPVMSVLQQALGSHHYARDLAPTHADTLFNMAQVLTSIAEIIAEDDDADDSEALQKIEQALEIQSRCFELQQATFAKSRLELEQAMRETAQHQVPQIEAGQVTADTVHEPQNLSQEEQWVSIEEPVTAVTLLETIIAQIEALSALCSILNSSPESNHMSTTTLSWIDSYSVNLLTHTLPTLLDENRQTLESRLSDVMLPKAIFTSNYLELSLRLSRIDVEKYNQELDTTFTQPGLNAASEDVLLASARALLSFNSALADLNSVTESHASLRWKLLVDAQSRLSSVARIPNIDKHLVATTHHLRGDISLFLQILAYPPDAHPQALTTTPQLLKHAEVYYRNASKLFGSLGRSKGEEKITCEIKGAVVGVLQQVTINQAAAGSSSGQDNSGTKIGVTASTDQIELALRSVLKSQGEQRVRDQIEDMINEGLLKDGAAKSA
ncbi:hypothetical protein GQX73_g3300 [Xylaria multiplex]|uniref:Uncharacterized protein n=1 Tax=Xylaria multiplex TaxID=323545 RepID=A0A7C8MWM6_9PEZI|nr:hypothetical protein GQX73_g3300 [Xylaria multiplex]